MNQKPSSLPDLRGSLARGSRLMGFDVGSKTVGLALSDVTLTVATPLQTLKRKKWSSDKEALLALLNEHNIGGYVIGYPVNMDGSEGPRVQATKAFARNLLALKSLPYTYWDERLSTAAVERTLLEADTSRQKRAEVVDKLAASYILQGALHAL